MKDIKFNKQLLHTIEIVPYPDKVLLSKVRRPVYYNIKNATKTQLDKVGAKFYFNEKQLLINGDTLQPIVKNKRTVGKPRYWKVNFQQIWNQAITKQARANIIHKLEDLVRPSISKCPVINVFPLAVELIIYDTGIRQDVHNRGVVYHKVFADLLQQLGKIPNDTSEYINEAGRTVFIKVENESEVRMFYNIYYNEIIKV